MRIVAAVTNPEGIRRILEHLAPAPPAAPAGLQAQERRFDSHKAIEFFDRHGRYEPLRHGLAGVASYLRSLLSADAGS
jgi:hypothetical protein